MSTKIHHLGKGWEPHVDEVDGKLIYSIPVDSGFVSNSFEFNIESNDLEVLKTNLYRYAVLYFAVHTLLQNTFGQGIAPKPFTQSEFTGTLQIILHSTESELESFIQEFNKKHNIILGHYVDDYVNRRK